MMERIEVGLSGHVSRHFPRPAPALMLGLVLLAQCGASLPNSNRQAAKEETAKGTCNEATGSGPGEVVRSLYKAYPPEGDKVPENEPMDVLLKYFDERFAGLLLKDRECTRRTGDLCKLTMSLIYAAQDTDIKDLHVCEPAPKSHWVEVQFLNFGEPESVFFEVKKTPRGWRISDMRYDANGSFAKMLSAP